MTMMFFFFLECFSKEERYPRASENLSSVVIPALNHSRVPTAREIVFETKDPLPGTAMSAAEENVRSTQQDVAEIER